MGKEGYKQPSWFSHHQVNCWLYSNDNSSLGQSTGWVETNPNSGLLGINGIDYLRSPAKNIFCRVFKIGTD